MGLHHFNPLPSSEGRRPWNCVLRHPDRLQSTSLIRGKTEILDSRVVFCDTSIHFPHPREDFEMSHHYGFFRYFNPLPSSEGRQMSLPTMWLSRYFNPLPSSEGRRREASTHPAADHFNPLPSSEGRLHGTALTVSVDILQSTSLIRGKTAKLPDSFLKSKYIFSTFIQFLLLSL